MKHLLSSALFFVVVAVPVASAADQDPGSPYYPLKIGSMWTYQMGASKVTVEVKKHEKVGDVLCAELESSIDGKVVLTEDIAAGEKGIFRYSADGQKASEPWCLLKLPAAKDQTWKLDSKIGDDTVKGTFKSGEEEITVPAGKYKTVTSFSTDCELNGNKAQKAEFKYWFAQGVGIVKQTTNIGGREIVAELISFKEGK